MYYLNGDINTILKATERAFFNCITDPISAKTD